MLNDHFLHKFIKNPQAFQMAPQPDSNDPLPAENRPGVLSESAEYDKLDRIHAYRQLKQLREIRGYKASM